MKLLTQPAKACLSIAACALTASPALFGNSTILQDFESFTFGPGGLSPTQSGSFDIVEGISPGSTQAVQVNNVGRYIQTWDGSGQTVGTFSFDFFNPTFTGEFTEPRVFFSLNYRDGNVGAIANNLIRISMGTQPGDPDAGIPADPNTGRFAFEGSFEPSFVNDAYPLDRLITAHLVLNNTDEDAFNPDGPVTVPANTVQLWMEIDGVQTLVGMAGLLADGTADRSVENITHFGFGTFSTYNRGGFIMDDIRFTSGIAVIPEPSTYAAFAGLLALGLVIVRRRILRKS